jgi:hypothetical protein
VTRPLLVAVRRLNLHERKTLQIPKTRSWRCSGSRARVTRVDQAKQELPDQVDTDQHADLLQKFEVDPQELFAKLGGDIPGL